jgi:thiamine-phosphate pyrophosphorylase
MTTRQEPRIPPRLYLVTELVTDAGALAQALAKALEAADIAAVLLRMPDELDERSAINVAKQIAPTVQERGAALLISGRPDIVARAGADGAHVSGLEAATAAFGSLKPDWIVGVGDLETRHDAMLAAEAGADYVMFGDPGALADPASVQAVLDRATWWGQVFQIPCVAFAAGLEEVAALAEAGADFIALGESVWNDGTSTAVAAAAKRLQMETVS